MRPWKTSYRVIDDEVVDRRNPAFRLRRQEFITPSNRLVDLFPAQGRQMNGTAEEDTAHPFLRHDDLLEHPRVADEDKVDVRGLQQVAHLFEEGREATAGSRRASSSRLLKCRTTPTKPS